MILQNVLLPQFIKVNLEADNKDQAFEELVNFYCKADNSKSYNEILKAIISREAKMSTGISKGIAVPHGRTNSVNSLKGVLGISQKGIDYDALDGEPVYLLFMLISPLEDSEKYLRLLQHLAKIMDVPRFQTELQAQTDPHDAFDVILKFEELFFARK
ncbi:MAG: PTS sugar transporter subunit IIA [Treponema sp.]|nr:PTS sugar transporter subunit IIA [Treponema sp.]